MRRLAILLTISTLASTASASEWTFWRGPFQTGFSPEKNLPAEWEDDVKDPKSNLVWKAPYGSRSTPIVMNGRVYLINHVGEKIHQQERVICLDAKTGKKLWEHRFNVFHTDIVTSRLGWTNLAADPQTEFIYAHGVQGLLFCFDKDGNVKWQRSLTEEYGRITGYGGRVVSPIVDEDLVIVGMMSSSWGKFAKGANRFAAFDKDTGKLVWWGQSTLPPKGTYYSNPVVADIDGQRLMITGSGDGSIMALQTRTGKLVWQIPNFARGVVNSSPVVDGNLVYIGHGAENYDNNIQGRVICLDASKVENGKPHVVWKRDGIKCAYATPILHDGILYVPDSSARLHGLDAKTGDRLWRFAYGRNARGSPVLADGKIYVGEVNSRFHIIDVSGKRPKRLHEHFFPSPDGTTDVELNGTPAVANGRVFFSTSEETYCIGQVTKGVPEPDTKVAPKPAGRAAQMILVPGEVALYPGESAKFEARFFDANGYPAPIEPAVKLKLEGLKGTLKVDQFTADKGAGHQHGEVVARFGDMTASARVRVVPFVPYKEDFEKVKDGDVPEAWVNTKGKFLVATLKDGNKVLRRVNTKASPIFSRAKAFFGLPSLSHYTVQADVMAIPKKRVTENMGKKEVEIDLPEMGLVANRYSFYLQGETQILRLMSWGALPRVSVQEFYPTKPNVWYRMKLTVDLREKEGIVKGKIWLRDEPEPKEWTIDVVDPIPNREGSPALYGRVLVLVEGEPGSDAYYDNVRLESQHKNK